MRLSVRDLRITFGSRRVVDLDRLEIGPGQIVGLAGESGSGKSMTALAILGLAGMAGATVTGSVKFGDFEMVGAAADRLREVRGRQIAMIFQSPTTAFSPVLRLGTSLMRALRLHGISSSEGHRRIEQALKEVVLQPELLSRYPHQLSGGQAQRLAIALAVALHCQLLLADEPTSALDVTVQAEILSLLRKLRDTEGLAMLFISHDLAVISELCDTITVLRAGMVVESGPTRATLSNPTDPYTQALVAAVPRLGEALI